jgi:DNA-binding XRE family transcriptional regulator
MNTESNWISLAECFEKIAREYGPIEVVWFAVAGHENFGNWILDPFHRRPEAARTDFCLAASRASELVGVRPVPIPNVLDHDPQWRDYCRLEEELHALAGQNIDLRDAVPYGFGEVDRDAIDPCTRAWLEVLRQEAAPFSMEPNGWQALKGEKIETIHRKIANVCELSTTFCKRRGRDEIRCRMGDSSAQATGAGAIGEPGPGCETTRQCPKEVIDRFKRRIPKLSYEKLAAKIGINKDTMYAITKELRWVSDETYELVANVCGCKPEDLHPRDIPRPERRR